MTESDLVDTILLQFRATGKWATNVYGGAMRTDGVSDIITHDKNNVLVLLEAKVDNNKPSRNQWNQGLDALSKGNRFIIAYEDFNIFAFDNDEIPKYEVGREDDAFILERSFDRKETVEITYLD